MVNSSLNGRIGEDGGDGDGLRCRRRPAAREEDALCFFVARSAIGVFLGFDVGK